MILSTTIFDPNRKLGAEFTPVHQLPQQLSDSTQSLWPSKIKPLFLRVRQYLFNHFPADTG